MSIGRANVVAKLSVKLRASVGTHTVFELIGINYNCYYIIIFNECLRAIIKTVIYVFVWALYVYTIIIYYEGISINEKNVSYYTPAKFMV